MSNICSHCKHFNLFQSVKNTSSGECRAMPPQWNKERGAYVYPLVLKTCPSCGLFIQTINNKKGKKLNG